MVAKAFSPYPLRLWFRASQFSEKKLSYTEFQTKTEELILTAENYSRYHPRYKFLGRIIEEFLKLGDTCRKPENDTDAPASCGAAPQGGSCGEMRARRAIPRRISWGCVCCSGFPCTTPPARYCARNTEEETIGMDLLLRLQGTTTSPAR